MRALGRTVAWLVTAVALAVPAAAQDLRITASGPSGELSDLEQGREVRVVFSEPMVALGRIPADVQAPFFRMEPAVPGTFRWSGTSTLIFTPTKPLPFGTRYEVRIEGATSLAGRQLREAHTYSFTTPTLRLLRASWYRQARRYDSPVVLLLRFNQPVTRERLAPHLRVAYQSHDWAAPEPPSEGASPADVALFQAKVARVRQVVQATDAVALVPARTWDQQSFPPTDDLLVWITETVPPADAWLRVRLGEGARGAQGEEPAGKVQELTVKLEPTFFVDGFRCGAACDPDSYNPLRLRSAVHAAALGRRMTVRDVTDRARPVAVPRRARGGPVETEDAEAPFGGEYDDAYDRSVGIALEDAGFTLRPARTYAVKVDAAAQSADGQTLGYTWAGEVQNWHRSAFTSFGSGHGVWEAAGGGELPFHARNLRSVTQWLAPLTPEILMPTLRHLEDQAFRVAPVAPETTRELRPRADRLQSFGFDLGPVLSPSGFGLGWAALRDGPPIARARAATDADRPRATLVQVTNLGLTVKDSPDRTLVFVTRLSDGRPVEGAEVKVRDLDNRVRWSGRTDAQGIATPDGLALRSAEQWWRLAFVVTAEKDGDVAYLASDWHEGLEPWMFGLSFDLEEAGTLLRGSVFADRGVYRLGEEVRLKAILRSDTAKGIHLLAPGTPVEVVVTDAIGHEVDKRMVTLGPWSSADFALSLPAEGALGHYMVTASAAGHRAPVRGSFLVAAYRRPEFRVDANLAGESSLAGVTLKGLVEARYLFGAAMSSQPARWTFSRAPILAAPPAVTERFPEERWAFLDQDWSSERADPAGTLQTAQITLDAQGRIALDLATDRLAGLPYHYTLESEVTDVSRQTLAGRASFRVDPAPWYLGLRRPGYFNEAERGLDTEIVAVGPGGSPAPGVPVKVTLTQIQWHGVRRAEGNGFYTWETERREVPAGSWDVLSTAEPVPLHVDLPGGGYFVLQAEARDEEGRFTRTALPFYALGRGYTAWERHDHNRIDLVPEKKRYRPGDTARILVKSPWETATALLTTEREGVRTHRTFTLDSTQQTVTVPVAAADIPNLFVSVLLVKGRTGAYTPDDTADPGKPAFRLGYAEIAVEDASRRLTVEVQADREEYRPGQKARVDVAVKDAQGRATSAEVTLWAVDYGVLSLTGYRTPDLLSSVYVPKALQVTTTDSRQRVVSRRATIPKGGDEGGGGGLEDGPGTPVRKDFRVLAFWLGSVPTDAQGRATTTVTLPESLTTYRIMAVAADRESRFGQGDREIRTSKPLLLRAAFPRFLSRGDTARFGAVVTNQLAERGTAIVTMRSLDPKVLEVTGPTKQTVTLGARGTAEVAFAVAARGVGEARVAMSVSALGETDAFEDTLPVRVLLSPEVVAAVGQTRDEAREALVLPDRVVPGFGGLQLDMASTALVGLNEGARYLVAYPYGCAEQRSSAALALMLAADLGEAFALPGLEPARLRDTVRATLGELASFQCADGAFAFWRGSCASGSAYVTSYVLHVLQRGRSLGYAVDEGTLTRAYDHLERELRQERPPDEGWWPAYTAWQAFAVRVLARGGRNVDAHLNRLWPRLDRMPVFALAYLRDVMAVRGETGPRPAELLRRLRNAILPEAASAHVEELADPYLLWFWNSNVRSSAIVLGTLVRTTDDEALASGLARWLLAARRNGRWSNTQENAAALEALVDYYRKYEREEPDFMAEAAAGRRTLMSEAFRGRSAEARTRVVPLPELTRLLGDAARADLTFTRRGQGTLHYAARLRYAPDDPGPQPLEQGFAVERRYAVEGGTPASTFAAGQLVTVTLTFDVPKERRYVAVTDPIPAGFEPVESWFATTASDLAHPPEDEAAVDWWRRGGFDRVERHDDRVLLFATRLSEGRHVFSYLVRATTPGRFTAAPARAEEMYEPEVFGRTGAAAVEVR